MRRRIRQPGDAILLSSAKVAQLAVAPDAVVLLRPAPAGAVPEVGCAIAVAGYRPLKVGQLLAVLAAVTVKLPALIHVSSAVPLTVACGGAALRMGDGQGGDQVHAAPCRWSQRPIFGPSVDACPLASQGAGRRAPPDVFLMSVPSASS